MSGLFKPRSYPSYRPVFKDHSRIRLISLSAKERGYTDRFYGVSSHGEEIRGYADPVEVKDLRKGRDKLLLFFPVRSDIFGLPGAFRHRKGPLVKLSVYGDRKLFQRHKKSRNHIGGQPLLQ